MDECNEIAGAVQLLYSKNSKKISVLDLAIFHTILSADCAVKTVLNETLV